MTGRRSLLCGRLQKLTVRLSIGLFVASLVHACYWHVRAQVIPYDDAYITYRYVQNFVAGSGLVYNPGEPVFGSSAPLYALWLAMLAAVTHVGDIPALAVRTNAVFYVAAGMAIVGLARQLTRSSLAAFCIGVLYAMNPEMLNISLGGMESFLFLALCFGTLWALCADRITLGMSLAAFSLLTRPEGLLLVAVCGLRWIGRSHRRDCTVPGIPIIILLPWVIFATLRYGTPVTHSIIAKSAPLYVLPPGSALATIMWQLTSWSAMSSSPTEAGSLLILVLVLAVTVTASYGLLRCGAMPARGGPHLAITLWMFVSFYAVTNVLLFEWYLPVLWSLWALVVIMGLPAFSHWIAGDARGLSSKSRVALPIVSIALSALLVARSPVSFYRLAWSSQYTVSLPAGSPERLRVQAYREAADWLNAHSDSSTTVLASEIGAFGYYFDGHVYDACGLVSPQALPYLPVPIDERVDGAAGAISSEFARAVQADYVVTLPVFSKKSIEVDPWFRSRYEPVQSIELPAPVWNSSEVIIWARKQM